MIHALTLGLLLPASALATLPPPPVVNGSETDDYPAVGTIVAEDGGDMSGSFCSGTLVDSNWVITAAHCVEAINEDYSRYNVYFVIGGDLTRGEIDDYALGGTAPGLRAPAHRQASPIPAQRQLGTRSGTCGPGRAAAAAPPRLQKEPVGHRRRPGLHPAALRPELSRLGQEEHHAAARTQFQLQLQG